VLIVSNDHVLASHLQEQPSDEYDENSGNDDQNDDNDDDNNDDNSNSDDSDVSGKATAKTDNDT
jgi:hypothetical protein